MALKLSLFPFPSKISRWVCLNACFSSISCANNIEIIPENDPITPNSSEFEGKIHVLKNNLCPDSLIRVLHSTNDLNSSMKLFKWASLQKRFRHTAGTYCQMIMKLGMIGNIDEMEGFCNEMVKEKLPGSEESLLKLLDWFIRNRRLNEALRVLVSMNSGGQTPSIDVYNVLLGALVEEKKGFSNVLLVYKEMVKSGIVPNVHTINSLLEALFEADRIETVLDQYKRMNKKGCQPNSRTFSILINGLISRDHLEESIVVLDEIFQHGFNPDFSFYATVIPVFCRMNKLEVGMRLLETMNAQEIVPDSCIYRVLFKCLCENFRIDAAINLLEEMIDRGLAPSNDLFEDIIDGLCKLEKYDEAKRFLEDKNISYTYPYNILLGAHCNNGNFLIAKHLFDEIIERKIADSMTWNIIIRCLCENKRFDEALEFLSRMIVSSHVPNSATYSALVVGKRNLDELEDALALFNLVRSKNWVLDSMAYSVLIEHLCQSKKIEDAIDVFCYMSSMNLTLESIAFNVLIKSLCEKGRVDRAIELLSYSCSSCSSATYTTIMLGLCKFKMIDVLPLVSRIIVEGCVLEASVYYVLIQKMSTLDRIENCILFFNLMVSNGLTPDSKTLDSLLSCSSRHLNLHKILPALSKLDSASKILDSSMFNVLINGLWEEGFQIEARNLLDLMLEKGWVPDARTHGLLTGSVLRDEIGVEFDIQDEIGSILAEGLGET